MQSRKKTKPSWATRVWSAVGLGFIATLMGSTIYGIHAREKHNKRIRQESRQLQSEQDFFRGRGRGVNTNGVIVPSTRTNSPTRVRPQNPRTSPVPTNSPSVKPKIKTVPRRNQNNPQAVGRGMLAQRKRQRRGRRV